LLAILLKQTLLTTTPDFHALFFRPCLGMNFYLDGIG
jgi:hypothetical protein